MSSILLVDPDEKVAKKVQAIVLQESFQVVHARNLNEALQFLTERSFYLVIASLELPDKSGIEIITELLKLAKHAPIIVIGHSQEEVLGEEAISLGAQDFILKSEIDTKFLMRVIHYAVERQMLLETMRALSFTDELTDVYNRRGFFVFLEQQMALSVRLKKGFYLFFIDVDYLKEINDTFGHPTGDIALIEAARCIQSAFRQYDIVGRMGGDEFAVIAINTPKSIEAYLKKHLIEQVAQANFQKTMPFKLSLSVGATYFDPHETITVDALLKRADEELYKEKRHKIRA